MNYLADLLSSEKVELDELHKKVPELEIAIEKLKTDVVCYIENVYVKYSGRPKKNKLLLTKAHQVEEEIKILQGNAEHVTQKELLECHHELDNHITSLESTNFALQVVSILCHINESLMEFKRCLNSHLYLECMKLVCNLEKLANEIPDDQYVQVIDELKVIINIEKNKLLNKLNTIFADSISVVENGEEKYVTVKIKKDIKHLEQALLALYFKNSAVFPLHSLAKSLWNYIFVPVVDHTVIITISEDDKYHILKAVTADAAKKSNYLEVFSNLKTVLKFLNDYFDVKINEELTSLGYIGIDIRDNLSEMIIKNCLQNTIPSNAEELQKYKIVIEDTKLLEKELKNCHIFTEDTTSIFEYANNVDILFINKKCNDYLATSRDIMKKDFHDMVEIGTPYSPDNLLGCKIDEFLQCAVSKSTIELVQFTEKIIQQALAASSVCGGRLFCTVQNIFRIYSSFVPEYHKKLLQTIPQQVALFHNNCFYIAFQLKQWNVIYSPKLTAALKTDCSFREEILQLQNIASEIFSFYVDGQLKQINDIMKESGLQGSTLEKLESSTEKCIRQCLRQQELLKTVWHKVLSYPVYNKTIGVILNSLCNIIIIAVVKFEDISCNAGEQLIEILKLIFTRGSKLFTDPKEVSLYVSSWYKLNELNFILGASLLDINDRWADAKGPLAMQFKPVELKQLIRALFQNTDRRSALLAKIQE